MNKALAALAALVVVLGLAAPAGAQRLRSSSSTLVLAQPTVTCGGSPTVNLSWTDAASTSTATYRVMSLPAGGKQNSWVAGPLLGNVRTTSVPVANNSQWQFAIEATTTVTRDSNRVSVSVACSPADITAPNVPTGVTADALSCTSVSVSWNAVADNTGGSGLKGYRLYRNSVAIAFGSGTTATDSTAAQAAGYLYQVSAVDNANNESAKSAAAAVATPACQDVTPPSTPTNVNLVGVTCTQMLVSWTASSDPSGILNYEVYRGSALIATVTSTSYGDNGVLGGTFYTYQVRARDTANNVSALSAPATAATPSCADTTAPQVPPPENVTVLTCSSVQVGWAPSLDTGGSGLKGYNIARAGSVIGFVAAGANTIYIDNTAAPSTSYLYQVQAVDNAGNKSQFNAGQTVTTPACADTMPPTVPTGLTASAASCSQVNVHWNASTDNAGGTGLKGYILSRNGVALPLVTTTSFNDAALAASLNYSYQVQAVDNAGNQSAKSAAVGATTPICADTAPPTTPALNAGATSCSQVNMNWTASTDTGGSGLSGYTVYRNGAVLTITAATSYSDTTGSASTQYSYQVDAVDNAGNRSAKSTAIVVTTPACTTGGTGSYFWAHQMGGPVLADSVNPRAVATDGSGNVIVTGAYFGTVNFGNGSIDNSSVSGADMFIAKYSAAGVIQWVKHFGDPDEQWGNAVATDASGNIYVAGYFAGTVDFGGGPLTSAGSWDVVLAKYSPTGAFVWAKRFGGASADFASSIALDGSGNVVVGGRFAASADFGGGPLTSAGGYDVFIAKYTNAGAPIWANRMGGASLDALAGVGVDGTGNVTAAGYFGGTANFGGANLTSVGANDIWVASYSATGAFVWQKRFGDVNDQRANAIAVDAAGNAVITGYFYGSVNFGGSTFTTGAGSSAYIFLAKLNASGNHVWSKAFGTQASSLGSVGETVDIDASGNVLLGAEITAFTGVDFGGGLLTAPSGSSDVVIAKYTAAGGYVWSKRFSADWDDFVTGITADASNNVVFVGNMYQGIDFGGGVLNSPGGTDGFVTKLSA